MAAPDLSLRTTAFVAKIGTDDAGYNVVGAPQARLTIAQALADIATGYNAATPTAPKVISLEPGVYTTPAFALPPNVFIEADPDAQGGSNAEVVINLTGNITLSAAWSANTAAIGGFRGVTIRQTTAQNIDLTMPTPSAGNPARTIVLDDVRTDVDSLSWEATSSADVLQVGDLIHDGNSSDAVEFSAGTQLLAGIVSAAPVVLNDTATLGAVIQAYGIFISAAPSATSPGVSFVSSAGGVSARIGASDIRAMTLNRGGVGALTVYADAISIPLLANVTYAGTATTANLIRTSDTSGSAGGTFYGLNGQTIVGDANGAWTITANGTNQNVTVVPSGTGCVVFNTGSFRWDNTNTTLQLGNSYPGLFFNGQGALRNMRQDANATTRIVTVGDITLQSYLAFDRTAGTLVAPSALGSGFVFGGIVGVGDDGNASSLYHGPQIQMLTTEAWTATAHGCEITFYTVPNATTAQALALRLSQSGQTLGQDGTSALPGQAFILEPSTGTRRISSGVIGVQLAGVDGVRFLRFGSTTRIRNGSGGAYLELTDGGAAEIATTVGANLLLSASGALVLSATGVTVNGTSALTGIRTATATLDFGNILVGASEDLTITVTGASVGDSVELGLPAAVLAGAVFNAWVSAANTVTVRCNNAGAIAIDPASASYRVTASSF